MLADSPEGIALLRDIPENPEARNPRAHAAAVTREIAIQFAELAASLEKRGRSSEDVAQSLMRWFFTAFEGDIGVVAHYGLALSTSASGKAIHNAIVDHAIAHNFGWKGIAKVA